MISLIAGFTSWICGFTSWEAGYTSRIAGLASRIAGLASRVAGLASWVAGLASWIAGLASWIANWCFAPVGQTQFSWTGVSGPSAPEEAGGLYSRICCLYFHAVCFVFQGLPGIKGEKGEKVGCNFIFRDILLSLSLLLSKSTFTEAQRFYRENLSRWP